MGESLAVGHFDADKKARVHRIPQQEGFNASQGLFRLFDHIDRAGTAKEPPAPRSVAAREKHGLKPSTETHAILDTSLPPRVSPFSFKTY